MTRVKICGLGSLPAALAAARRGADAVGLVFVPSSRRRVEVELAGEICRALPPFLARVGVFANQPLVEVLGIAAEVGLSAIQLHGDEPPEYCASLSLPVIKALRVRDSSSLEALGRYPVHAYLLDSHAPHRLGGTGQRFDWDLARRAVREGHRIILAGGLNAENVTEAVQRVRPYAVDVSSGVETQGEKDVAKIAAFLEAVRVAEARAQAGAGA